MSKIKNNTNQQNQQNSLKLPSFDELTKHFSNVGVHSAQSSIIGIPEESNTLKNQIFHKETVQLRAPVYKSSDKKPPTFVTHSPRQPQSQRFELREAQGSPGQIQNAFEQNSIGPLSFPQQQQQHHPPIQYMPRPPSFDPNYTHGASVNRPYHVYQPPYPIQQPMVQVHPSHMLVHGHPQLHLQPQYLPQQPVHYPTPNQQFYQGPSHYMSPPYSGPHVRTPSTTISPSKHFVGTPVQTFPALEKVVSNDYSKSESGYFRSKEFKFPQKDQTISKDSPPKRQTYKRQQHKRDASHLIDVDQSSSNKKTDLSTNKTDKNIIDLIHELEKIEGFSQTIENFSSQRIKGKLAEYVAQNKNKLKQVELNKKYSTKRTKDKSSDYITTKAAKQLLEETFEVQIQEVIETLDQFKNVLKSWKDHKTIKPDSPNTSKLLMQLNSSKLKAPQLNPDSKKGDKLHRHAYSEGSIKPELFLSNSSTKPTLGESPLIRVDPIAPYIVATPKEDNFLNSQGGLHEELSFKQQSVCLQCQSVETPEWRKGPDGLRTLCNACGLFHAKLVKKLGEQGAEDEMKRRRETGRSTDRKVS